MSGQTAHGDARTLHRALRRQPPGADLCTVCLVTIERTAGGVAADRRARRAPAAAAHRRETGKQRRSASRARCSACSTRSTSAKREAEMHPGETLLALHRRGTRGRPTRQAARRARADRAVSQAPQLTLARACWSTSSKWRWSSAEGSLRDDIALLALRMRRKPAAIAYACDRAGSSFLSMCRQETGQGRAELHGELDLLARHCCRARSRATPSPRRDSCARPRGPPVHRLGRPAGASSPHTSARVERGQELAITPGSQQVQRLFSIAGVDEHLRDHRLARRGACLAATPRPNLFSSRAAEQISAVSASCSRRCVAAAPLLMLERPSRLVRARSDLTDRVGTR